MPALTLAESSHEYFDRLCALVVANQTTTEQEFALAEHLLGCPACKHALGQYKLLAGEMYQTGAEAEIGASSDGMKGIDSAELSAARERALGNWEAVSASRRSESTLDPSTALLTVLSRILFQRVPGWSAMALATGLVLLGCFGSVELRRERQQARAVEERSTILQNEVVALRHEQDEGRSTLKARSQSSQTAPARTRDSGAAQSEIKQLLATSQATANRQATENADLQQQARILRASIEVLQASNRDLTTENSGLNSRIESLTSNLRQAQEAAQEIAARNEELSQEASTQIRSVERQQKLLATDHDIRDILGARSLRIIDVYDVGSQGELERPFGRVFYTEGKSLIFYAFDLDRQKGLKSRAVFQAWGQKEAGDENPYSLGAFYVDDASQNRWILKVADVKLLSRIDYVFVTDGSRQGAKPKGKPILSAFLNSGSNHPQN